eukprot:gb/GECG01000268.1/.p1 GENE.gb/GECG01000268.1/~~gb/GECG01000268.1/.p1  ORF type:complete len:521 (+),score=37.74 gb/GECG01000268.1/:1-1563(+)
MTTEVAGSRSPSWLPACKYTPNKWVLFGVATFQAITTSEALFGWPNIQPVLVEKGVFIGRCDPEDLDPRDNSCDSQLERLGLVFTVGSACYYIFSLVNGLFLDRFGMKLTVILGLFMWTAALAVLGIAFSDASGIEYGKDSSARANEGVAARETAIFFIGFALFGAAAVALFHPMYSISNLFHRGSNTVVTVINGAADSSAVMFLIIRLVFFSTPVGLDYIFWGYLLGPVAILFCTATVLLPRWPIKSGDERSVETNSGYGNLHGEIKPREGVVIGDALSSSSDAFGGEADGEVDNDKDISQEKVVHLYYPLLGQPFMKQVRSYRFLGGALFTWINFLKFNYYLITLSSSLKQMGDTEGTYTQVFGWISLGGVIAAFFSGTVIDRLGLPAGFWCTLGFGILLSIFSLIPVLELQPVTFVIFVVFRSLLFSIISTFLSTEFGHNHFGKLIGVTNCVGGGFAFLAQPLLVLGLSTFDKDFTIPGLIVFGVTIAQTAIPILYTRTRNHADQLLEERRGAAFCR